MNNVIAWPGREASLNKIHLTKEAARLRIQVRRTSYTVQVARRANDTLAMQDRALRPQTV